MILATLVAIVGGITRSPQLLATSTAMITAAGTSFQVQYKVQYNKKESNMTE
jgi:hypothetical protein